MLMSRAVTDHPDESASPFDFVQRILGASRQYDPLAVRTALDEADATLGLARCVDEVLMPVMRQVGIWWAEGLCEIDQERMTTEAVRAWLEYRVAFAPAPTTNHPILLACGPRDRHTIGLEALAVMLRFQSWPCRVLGSRISTSTLITAATATDAVAVIVVSHFATGWNHAVASIRAVADSGIQVFYAGHTFFPGDSREDLPGLYLGSKMEDACELVVATLSRSG